MQVEPVNTVKVLSGEERNGIKERKTKEKRKKREKERDFTE